MTIFTARCLCSIAQAMLSHVCLQLVHLFATRWYFVKLAKTIVEFLPAWRSAWCGQEGTEVSCIYFTCKRIGSDFWAIIADYWHNSYQLIMQVSVT